MKKRFQSYLLPAVIAVSMTALVGCNSSDTWEASDTLDMSGTEVTAFSLKPDTEVLNNLDSVFFSIDLIEGKIFNASPLPYGTKTEAIAVSISSDACTVAQLLVPALVNEDNEEENKEAEVIDYLTTPDYKIDFSRGPVTLHLVSADGKYQRDYEIKVNVAAEKTDSLYWDKLQSGSIPGVTATSRVKAVKVGDKALLLSQSAAGKVEIRTFTPDPTTGGGVWDPTVTTPLFTDGQTSINAGPVLNVETLTITSSDELFVTDYNGNLYRSQDNGATFIKVASGWETITSPYGATVIGIQNDGTGRQWAAFPPQGWTATSPAVPTDFPLTGVSAAAEFSTKWTTMPQIVLTGGKTAAGLYTGATWAFDGNRWAKISDRLPAAAGYAMTKYTVAETDTVSWRTTTREVLLAYGGKGYKDINEVWISRDMGVNWQKGSQLLQMPEYIPFTTGASLLVFDKTLNAQPGIAPLAVTPITSWECPYLYLFGGYDTTGKLHSYYWSGVVNHLKLKPLQ